MPTLEFTVYKGSEGGKIIEGTSVANALAPNEVLIKITHAGLCGTDLHYRGQDMVLGHEGVGVVQQIGTQVTHFKVGDRAGWGYLHESCMNCENCLTGDEILCPERHMYGTHEHDRGAFASHAVWNESYLFHIPDEISSSDAAPMMCGGATVFNALEKYGVRDTDRVGVVGVGGLGHFAIQIAAKMGCEVVVFSSMESKKEEAIRLGATEFYPIKGAKELKIGKLLNQLLVTTSQQPDWDMYLSIMAPGSTIFPLTVSEGELKLPYEPILVNAIRVQGCICPSRAIHMKFLRFAAFHKIKPVTQEFPLTKKGIEEAMDRLDKGDIKYRAVLVADKA
ncbi:GroES-like protein [Coniophora puteana RWD-64-598 SS2]|uniref:GroES-like protein n=1 Tax=Coniophora puteana (strain RWD-64-598) TaxID=741705 RepID=A0A5M3MXX2_CONPW|nr:GroES-like protein [Coniophora puteana RWD-64-598 SS2]EIW83960.1 GroES-like protein [Coniophora puteana RWD-64-598 SS2]